MVALSLDDGTLYYETAGDGSPLVFLHGGWMDGNAWRPQVDRFAEDYRVITLDARGHGRTGETDASRYSIELFADDLEALLAHLEIDRPILSGLSLGSMVVQEYLHRHPDRAAGAILGGPVRSMPPIELPPGTKSLFSPVPAMAASLSVAGTRATFRSMLTSIRATTGNPWLSADPAVRSAAIDGVEDMPREEFRKIFDALYRYDPPALTGVETPTLTVFGEYEAPLVKRQGRALSGEVDDGEWVSVPDAAHLVNQDNVIDFNRISRQFLSTLEAS